MPATASATADYTAGPQHRRPRGARAVPAGAGADDDDAGAPRLAQVACGNRRVGRTALRLWFALLLAVAGCLVVAAVHHEFAFWLVSDLGALQTVRFALMALAVAWAALFFDAWRLGQPLTLRMGHRRAAVGDQRHPLLLGRRGAALRRAPGRRPALLHPDHVRLRRRVGRPRRPLQRAAARRRLGRRPLGAAARLDHRRQHRRRDRPHRADLAAAQHAELPLRQGLGHAPAVPAGLRLRALHAQRRQHLGAGQQGAVRQVQDPRRSTPRSWPSRGSPG